MEHLWFQQGTVKHKTLIVFLPGIRDEPRTFVRHGFVDAVRRRNITADMVAVHAHIGYLRRGNLVARLKNDIIEPAQRKGYRRIWLVGNSLGGLSALLYIKKHPGDIDAVYLLAPYLGEAGLLQEIQGFGSLKAWQPGAAGRQHQYRDLWRWLQQYRHPQQSPAIYLGYGRRDRLVAGHRLLAGSLPTTRVLREPGGHNWKTWRRLWHRFLDRKLLP